MVNTEQLQRVAMLKNLNYSRVSSSYIQTKNAHGTRGEKTLYFFTPRDRVRNPNTIPAHFKQIGSTRREIVRTALQDVDTGRAPELLISSDGRKIRLDLEGHLYIIKDTLKI
ncbi:hypothetical protein WN944_024447 [Citrus x changshan-huyou]|uniref:Uncharacterized protein n=1 Tax=Citrus x changshan-huyou TaxID=2935761 RepID=A0AAP0QCM2_9ROSI